MNTIDKIEVYTTVDFNNVTVTEHAIDQALERFDLKNKNRNKVAEWIRNKLRHSEFKSTVKSEKYSMARVYVNEGIVLILDIHRDIVLTVYPLDVRKRVKSKIQRYVESECKRVSNLYTKKKRNYELRIADLRVEKATLERDLMRTRSQSKYFAKSGRVKAIDISITEMLQELTDLHTEVSEFEISLANYK